MRAAGVGPGEGEGDLVVGALLEKKAAERIKEEDAEGPVQQPRVDVGVQVACMSVSGGEE